MTASQSTIAEALNISVATVSRSLRNHPAISAETRARVAEAAVRLGYRAPDDKHAARGRPRRPDVLPTAPAKKPREGFVHLAAICRGSIDPNSVHNLVALRIIQGMSRGARANRASLHVEFFQPHEFDDLINESAHPLVIRESLVSGALLVNQPGMSVIQSLSRVMPCINFERYFGPLTADCVTEDNLGSISKLFDHLLALGHTKIGLADSTYCQPSYTARFAAYVENIIARQMVYDPADATLPDAPQELPARLEILAAHIAHRIREHGTTAWICLNDYIGYSIMRQLTRYDLHAPRDYSICGFDNFDPPAGLPKLATIDGPFETMGEIAVTRLVQRIIQRQLQPVHILLPARFIAGESTGPNAHNPFNKV